jgi:hypothetical protein
MALYANFKSYEGNLSGSETIDFPWNRAYGAIIMNDSSSTNLSYTLNGEMATLKPTETISFAMQIKSLVLSASGDVAYRVLLYG